MIAKGASLGFKLTLLYWLMFVLAASIRYGRDLAAAPPDGGLWPALAGGVVSLAVASLGIALIMGMVAAALGALTALLAVAIDRWWNTGRRPQRAAEIGLAVAAAVVLLLHWGLSSAGLWSWSSFFSTTYLFWLGAPALVYLMAAYWAGLTSERVRG